MADILIAEDDAHVRKWVAVALESQGYAVDSVPDGSSAIKYLRSREPRLLILDVMMPGPSGLEVCRELRLFNRTLPVMMLTARNSENDILAGFEAGADDYVTKPFSLAVLFARVAALLRRTACTAHRTSDFKIGNHTISSARMAIITPDDENIPLTARELELLTVLNQHRGEALNRNWLLNHVWGFNFYGNTRTLDQHIALIRRKLKNDAKTIKTIRHIGYQLKV